MREVWVLNQRQSISRAIQCLGASSSAVTGTGSMSVGMSLRRSNDFCSEGRMTPSSFCSFLAAP